ncbi:[Skp1-protein]-hydroxyproline N-acetylglucosaminyltransferase [Acrasis kona]|uniref:[Skp1-protein]-hydroxyproline N-acetylglucosaminyltransferase n=1 Tax=Acrasis kona TaxID=1008807 RepID=A0AAW2ZAA8_9EUKA
MAGDKENKKYGTISIRYPTQICGIRTRKFLIVTTVLVSLLTIGYYTIKSSGLVIPSLRTSFIGGPIPDYLAIIPPYSKKDSGKTIFVNIASFRDNSCMNTLQSIYRAAMFPQNVYVGILQQNSDRDSDCLTINNLDDAASIEGLNNLIRYKDNIRIHRINYQDALGPVYARWTVMDKLYRNEDFILQVDSHTRFRQDWDARLLRDMSLLPKKAALSHYPLEYDVTNNTLPSNYLIHMPIMCNGFYNSDDILQPGGAIFHVKDLKSKPAEGAFLAAGFSFYSREANEQVPLDPNLPHLFHGEELLFSVRMAAHGYRFYSPSENVCFHFYTRKGFPKFWENPPASYANNLKQSLQRVKYILNMLPLSSVDNQTHATLDLDKYGLDRNDPKIVENLKVYTDKFGINFEKKLVSNLCNEKDLMLGY